MRQAGTAPATGTTICCPPSLLVWCTVIYKRCSAMDTTNTLLQANVRLVLWSDLCRIYCAIYLCCIRSFGVFGVASCVTVEVRFMCVDLNGSNASLRRLRVDQRGFPSRRVLIASVNGRVTKPAGLESVRHFRRPTDDTIFRMHYVSLLWFEPVPSKCYFLLLLCRGVLCHLTMVDEDEWCG